MLSGLISAVRGASVPFQDADDYVSHMRDPSRVVHVEWRKVRHEKSRGLTSHSWLEVHLMDGRRMRIEIYADRGYTEMYYDPSGPPEPRFFDPQSTVYDGHVAEAQDLAKPLTASLLSAEAKAIGDRPYALSEFNCHHFVLQVWNSIVLDSLKTNHYPDRAKTGLLWGLEETVGSWFQGFGSIAGPQEGAAHRCERPPVQSAAGYAAGSQAGLKAPGAGVVCGHMEAAERSAATFDASRRLELFCGEVQAGNVFLLETDGPLMPTALPPGRKGDSWEAKCEAWASACVPNVGYPAIRLAERINELDLNAVVAQLFKPKKDSTAMPSFASLSSLNSMPSLGSLSSLQSDAPQFLSRQPRADACYVVLRGKELRLAIYAVLRPSAAPGACAWRLLLLSGDVLFGEQASFTYALCDLPELHPTTSAEDLAREDLRAMQVALRNRNWALLVPECHTPSWTAATLGGI